MPDYLWTERLEAAAKALNVSLTSPQTLAGDGSDRRYYRLLGSPTVVLLFHPFPPGGEVNENDSYYLVGRHLRGQGVPVPEIYTYCREEFWMLVEDLGDISLETVVKRQSQESQIRHWYRQALGILVDMQIKGEAGFDSSWCFDTPVVDRNFLWERECGYFVKAFLNTYLGLPVSLADLAPDFDRLLTGALPSGPDYFLHRDFQSRNLFVTSGRLRVIDFQGGRRGPLGYDVASLLIDPYVDLSPAWQAELLDYYLGLLASRLEVDARGLPGAIRPPGPVPQPADPGGLRLPDQGEGQGSVRPVYPRGGGGTAPAAGGAAGGLPGPGTTGGEPASQGQEKLRRKMRCGPEG